MNNIITDSPILFNDIVEYKESWTELGESQTNYIFQTYYFDFTQETKPLWKILVIPQANQLVLLLSHAMYDGMSSVKVWSSFMSCLQEVASMGSIATDSKLDPVVFYQAEGEEEGTRTNDHPYTRWPIPIRWKVKRQIVSWLFRVSPRSILAPDPNLLQFEGYRFPEGFLSDEVAPRDKCSRRYKVRNDNVQHILQLTPDQLRSVRTQCKAHKVSLTSFIVSLFALSLKTVIINNDNNSGSHIKVDIPMDTRAKCEASLPDVSLEELQLGNFIAGIEYTDDIAKYSLEDDEVIWQVAQSVQAKIGEARTSKLDDIVNNVKLLEVVNDVTQFVDQKVDVSTGTGPSGTFEVTNLGYVDYGGHCSESSSSPSEFYVRDAQWNEPQGFSNIFTCCVLSTPLGGLNCSISVPRGIATEFGSVLENVRKLLRGCEVSV